jgi:hypothetical protein
MSGLDEVLVDVNTIIAEQFVLRGRGTGSGSSNTIVCGVLIDTTQLTRGVMTLSYTNSKCDGRTRTGEVEVVFQNYPIKKWKSLACIATVTLKNYKVLQNKDGVSIKYDGVVKMQNQSGGTWYDMWYLNQTKLVYDVSAEKLKITFGPVDYGVFQINRRMTFTHVGQITICTVSGLGSAQGENDLECWGENRVAEDFTCKITDPYQWRTSCSAWAIGSGETEVHNSLKAHTLKSTYGVDANGNGQDPESCTYGYKVTWDYKRNSNTRIFAFY